MITVTLDSGYSESYATMGEAREALILARNAGVDGAIWTDGRTIRIGDAAWHAYSAGVNWASREWDAHPDPASAGAWRSSAIDALPLVDGDRDLADIANAGAREHWDMLLSEVA